MYLSDNFSNFLFLLLAIDYMHINIDYVLLLLLTVSYSAPCCPKYQNVDCTHVSYNFLRRLGNIAQENTTSCYLDRGSAMAYFGCGKS